MRKLILYIMCVVAVSLFSCTPTVENAKKVDRRPSIYPDYLGVTIPAGSSQFHCHWQGCRCRRCRGKGLQRR